MEGEHLEDTGSVPYDVGKGVLVEWRHLVEESLILDVDLGQVPLPFVDSLQAEASFCLDELLGFALNADLSNEVEDGIVHEVALGSVGFYAVKDNRYEAIGVPERVITLGRIGSLARLVQQDLDLGRVAVDNLHDKLSEVL